MADSSDAPFPRHSHEDIDIAAKPSVLFSLLDDPRRLAAHMEKPSLMMAGGTMRLSVDAQGGQAVGSEMHLEGQVLGLRLALAERVTERLPPWSKVWQTVAEPRLLVIGPYQMGFTISPQASGSRLRVFIDYRLPPRGIARALGILFADTYARWCVRRIARNAQAANGQTASP